MNTMQRRGVPLIVCAPSGTGKTTLIKMLRDEFPLSFSISCTTRAPRNGEIDGKDYHFLNQETFLDKIQKGEFVEWAKVHNNYYGTLKSTVNKALECGQDLIFDIDVQGAAQLSLALSDAKFAFIFPPSLQTLEERLNNRSTDSADVIEVRLKNAKKEIQASHWFDCWIINDNLNDAYDALRSFYISCTLAPRLNEKLIVNILSENNMAKA